MQPLMIDFAVLAANSFVHAIGLIHPSPRMDAIGLMQPFVPTMQPIPHRYTASGPS